MFSTDPAPAPARSELPGAYVTVVPLSAAAHGDDLWKGCGQPEHASFWDYMSAGPFATRDSFDRYLERIEASADPLFYAVADNATCRALGYAALMRIDRPNRVIEAGHIMYSLALRRSRQATEAMYLLARYVFDTLGYRRYEWKCNTLNLASRQAAVRLGFQFEGIFRQHMIVKGASRDTAWFAMLDGAWPTRRSEFERWLDPGNFDTSGRQLTPLAR